MITPGKRNYILLSLFRFLSILGSVIHHGVLCHLDNSSISASAPPNRPAVLRQRLHCSVDAAFLALLPINLV